jgi:hypothetical protein
MALDLILTASFSASIYYFLASVKVIFGSVGAGGFLHLIL